MLNEDVLFRVLKDNFEKLNKKNLSEFNNDLYYEDKKVSLLKLTKEDLIEFEVKDGEEIVSKFYGYKSTPKSKWISDWEKNIDLFDYDIKVVSKDGQVFTRELDKKININQITGTNNKIIGNIISIENDMVHILNGLNATAKQLTPEDAFYVNCIPSEEFDQILSYELEIFAYQGKRIPANCLNLDELMKIFKRYYALNQNAIFSDSITLGYRDGTKVIGQNSLAIGVSNIASGNNSCAIGNGVEASGSCAHAEGDGTIASGNWSHAEGSDTIASSNYQHVQGKYNIEDTENKYAHIVGNGRWDSEGDGIWKAFRSNAHTLTWTGDGWYAGKLSQEGTPTKEKDLTTKKYVDDKIPYVLLSNLLSENSEGEAVLELSQFDKDKTYIIINDFTTKNKVFTTSVLNLYNNGEEVGGVLIDSQSPYLSLGIRSSDNLAVINGTQTCYKVNITDKKTTISDVNSISSKVNRKDVLMLTNTTQYTPTTDYHPATKKYVDENGLTPTAKTLLATLLQNIPYSTDQSANVTAFLQELGVNTTQS